MWKEIHPTRVIARLEVSAFLIWAVVYFVLELVRSYRRNELPSKRCVHKLLAQRYHPDDGTHCLLMGLPVEITTKILRQIASHDPKDLESLLIGIPALSRYVLLITDHEETPHALFRATACGSMSLEDFDKNPRKAVQHKALKVFSFLKAEHVVGQESLTRDVSCLYARHLDRFSTVFVGGRGLDIVGSQVIRDLAITKGAPPPVNIRVCNEDKSHVQISNYDPQLQLPKSMADRLRRFGLRFFLFRDPDIPLTFGILLSFRHLFYVQIREHFICMRHIKRLSLNVTDFGFRRMELRHVEVIKIRFGGPKPAKCLSCPISRRPDHGEDCHSPVLGIAIAPRLKELYIEFNCAQLPLIQTSNLTSQYLVLSDGIFSIVNSAWSPSQPFKVLCKHMTGTVFNDLHTAQVSLKFLGRFKEATFIGVTDKLLEISNLTNVEKLTWKRLMPTEILDSSPEPYHLQCYRLKHVNITTLLMDEFLEPMPMIHGPSLESVELHALPGSTRRWDLGSIFSDTRRSKHLTKVHIEQDGCLSQPALVYPLSVLASVAGTLQDLTIRGYIPSFACPRTAHEQQAHRFPQLTRLELDLTRVPIENVNHVRHVPIVISRRQFPNLHHLHLHADVSAPGLHDGDCKVLLEVPPQCERLSFDGLMALDRCIVQDQTLYGGLYNEFVFYEKVGGVWGREDGNGAAVSSERC